MRKTLRTAGLLVLCLGAAPVAAQVGPATPPLRVFLDCPSYRCDPDFFRTAFPFADFARSPEDADVQILVTTEATGGGGGEYTVTAIGRHRFTGWADTLTTYTAPDATDDDRRRAIAQRMGLALARYVALSPAAGRFVLTYTAPDSEQAALTQRARDPWDYWAFRIGTSANLDGEKSYHSLNLRGNLNATRITPDLKIEVEGWGSRNRSESVYASDTTADSLDNPVEFTDVTEQRRYGASILVAPSLGAHWSWATYGELSRNSYENQAMELDLLAGVEYDIWPYTEVTRRLLAIRAYTGIKSFRYDEVTLYDETAETRPVAALEAHLSVTEPWGSVGGTLENSIYLHDLSKHRVELSGEMDVRLLRGLSLSLWGEVASIHDQLGLPRSDLDPLDVVARRRELATNYSYYTSVGLNYRFGSAFNNVVNPRFR